MSLATTESKHAELHPRVFIGSSSEALDLARNIRTLLGDEIEADVWDQKDILKLGENLLDGLLRIVKLYDFAIFVLSGDDVTSSRGTKAVSPRDNVVFELGMCMGVLGRRRTFPVIVFDRSRTFPVSVFRRPDDLKLPSDLAGNLSVHLDSRLLRNNPAYLSNEVARVRDAILDNWKEIPLSLLPSLGLANGYYHNFLIPVSEHFGKARKVKLNDAGVITELDFDGKDYDFQVLIPKALSKANVKDRNIYVSANRLRSVSVGEPPRVYDFFMFQEGADGRVSFADYPTTLRASYEAIGLALQRDTMRRTSKEQTLLEEREVRNFVKTLEVLLDRPDTGELKGRVAPVIIETI